MNKPINQKILNKRLKNFINKANKLYNNKFDYSNCIFIKVNLKMNIKCNVHNLEFQQSPKGHLKAVGM